MKKYTIYNKNSNEEYAFGFNSYTAFNNMNTFRNRYGDVVDIKWEDVEMELARDVKKDYKENCFCK